MSHPFFRPREVHACALLLVGYRLYPYARIELHPRLTFLAGGNGVGKTTLLDALQTILIADQRYVHMNVAAGQNDRDLGGQMQGRVGWATLHLMGHPEVRGIGVHLARRAAAEYVDVKPFAIIGVEPDRELFFSGDKPVITADIKELARSVARRSPKARVKEFAALNDYHRFLYEEGLIPIDLSRGGRRRFSLLWRQATQPHLGELNKFLQQTLCHEPEKKLTFEDVEGLMRERIQVERQLRRLGELRALDMELRGKAEELDRHRRRFLGLELGQAGLKIEGLAREIEEGEKEFREVDERIAALKTELDGMRATLADLGRERDKHIREQGEWSRKYKHHQEYVALKSLSEELEEELSVVQEEIFPLESTVQEIREEIKYHREDMQDAASELARWKEKANDLDRQVKKWNDFQHDLDHACDVLGREIETASDLEDAWARAAEEKRGVGELKSLRQLLGQWESRANAHGAAVDLARKMTDPWPDFFEGKEIDRGLLDAAQARLQEMERDIDARRRDLLAEKKPLNALIGELSRGRLPLPPAAAALVEAGLASPFVSRFDGVELDTAREAQDLIGPLAYAIEPLAPGSGGGGAPREDGGAEEGAAPHPGLARLARGKEPFWLVLSPEVWKDFRVLVRNEHGIIAGFGGVGWYMPNGPVRIGAEARREQTQRAQDRLLAIEEELKGFTAREASIAQRLKAIRNFLPKLDAHADAEAADRAARLREQIREIEQTAPRIDETHALLQKLFQRSELFNFAHAPEETARIKENIASAERTRQEMEEKLKTLKARETEAAREQGVLQNRLLEIRRELDRIQTIRSRIEEEEPEEVLQGLLDFGKPEELQERVKELDEEREKVQGALSLGEREHGELRSRCKSRSESLARRRQELERARAEAGAAVARWKTFYPEEEPLGVPEAEAGEREEHKAAWDGLAQTLRSRVAEVGARYDLRFPENEQPDRQVLQLLQLLLPPGVALDRLEEQYLRLQTELRQIESKIKGHVEGIRSTVEAEIRRLKMHMARVNRILSTLSFGRIKKVHLEIEELPAFQALKRLESFLPAIQEGEVVTLREFVEKLRAFIQKESNTVLSEEQIADYRSYIRLRRVIVDREDRVREGGLSSGETLGVNLALCLSILFFLGRQDGVDSDRGMLMLALDEAERLDVRALETIRGLLDEVRCQLTVAMPRPVDVSDSICHLLTPLSQGVTHVHLYHRGMEKGEANQTPSQPT